MKYQKAKSILHQHSVTLSRLKELEEERDKTERTIIDAQSRPFELKDTLHTVTLEMETLIQRLGVLKEKAATIRLELSTPESPTVRIARSNLLRIHDMISAQEKVVARFQKDREEALRTIALVTTKEEERKLREQGMSEEEKATLKEAVKREQEIREGKRIPRTNAESMGNAAIQVPTFPKHQG
jgi:hypothetical protein